MSEHDIGTALDIIKSAGLVRLFESIADTYKDGKRVSKPEVQALIAARVVRWARGRAHLTGLGWSVSTRIAALEGARRIVAAGPSPYRS